MSDISVPVILKPRYNGTIVCPHCHAEYRPCSWRYGYYNGTEGTLVEMGKIPQGYCPSCRRNMAMTDPKPDGKEE